MTDTLLRELSNSDLDWLITSGERKRFSVGEKLAISPDSQREISIIIEGRLDLIMARSMAQASSKQATRDELNQGEIIGAGALLDKPETTVVGIVEPSLLLLLPVAKVQEKLNADIAFAAHFYRAIAIMFSDRLRRIFEQPGRIRFWGERSAHEVLSVFGELRDSDVDWLVSFGQTETIPADRVVLQAGRPVDALTILLDGHMAISAPEDNFNPLYLCFSGLANSTRDQPAFATLSKGSMPGIMSFLDFRPLPVTIRTLQECLIFTLSRQLLTTKLQADDSFASRFYRVIAIQTLELLQTVSARLVEGGTDDDASDDEALDMDDLQQMSEGATKFNWMLSQLGVNPHG